MNSVGREPSVRVNSPTMNERQRMQYLEAMGIDMFVPRVLLPSAAAPVRCSLPLAPANTPMAEAAVEPKPSRSHGEPKLADIGELLRKARTPAVTTEASPAEKNTPVLVKDVPVPAEPEGPVEIQQEARFSLAIWRVSRDVLAVDTREVGAGLPTDALLANMARCFGMGSGSLAAAEVLNWPMVELQNKPKDWHAAREMVASLLEGKLLSEPVSQILLFGEAAYKAVAVTHTVQVPEPSFGDHLLSVVAIDAFAADGLVLPSLAETLRNPGQKKAIWQFLAGQTNKKSYGEESSA